MSLDFLGSYHAIEDTKRNALMDSGFLPMPQCHAMSPTRHFRIDYLIPTPNGGRLAIECAGLLYYATPTVYITDRLHDNLLISVGVIPLRFSSVTIENDVEGCIKTVENVFGDYQRGKCVYYRDGCERYFGTDPHLNKDNLINIIL